ncbi:adenylate/guanylate cyclase domain-containing protein [Mycobacterium sp. B14F4]|uniref:adenylate/guanylate cyclase domain-containing protein n=1 Tax=Mycobacterium sp. B14F4 TaxID=3153565 RepID=UPI00325D07A0
MGGTPETRYAVADDLHIAYQVVGGDGPDVLLVLSPNLPIDLLWDDPTVAEHLGRLASFSRLIMTDLLGVGSSDAAPPGNPSMQVWTDCLLAVLDAAGSERAAVFGMTESALAVMMLAASQPARVRSLVLASSYAYFLRAPDQPFGFPERDLERYVEAFGRNVGTGATVDILAPSWANNAAKVRWWARCERLALGPGGFKRAFHLFAHTDVRPLLSTIQAPTLVLSRRGDRHVRCGHARYLADRIPDARLAEFDGDDSLWFAGDADSVLDEVETFLTGTRGARPSNRVLATVLFTDIVDSTARATSLGDDAWSRVLAAHDRLVERHVAGWRGELVKFTGDGVLATFDGPARAIECARAVSEAVRDIGVSIRAGLHTGEIEKADDDVHGIAVHVAARILSLARAGEVLVSSVIPPLVLGSGLPFADRGEHDLKGLPGPWRVYAVDSATDRRV